MHIRIAILITLTLLSAGPFAFGQATDWSAFHGGVFYVYSSTDGQHYVVYQNGQTQTEVIDGTEDSIISHIQWLNDSDYTAQFVSSNLPLNKDQERFFKHHKLYYHLHSAGKDFCVYTETADKLRGTLIEKDTIWLHEVSRPAEAPLVREVRSESILRGMRFSDTSSYAIVYLYRPLTMMFSEYSYNVYMQDHWLCNLKNNSQHIFAVYQKGPFTLRSRLGIDTCSISLNIEPGKSYYIMSTLHFGLFHERNYNLVMELVPAEKGKKEFDRTYKH